MNKSIDEESINYVGGFLLEKGKGSISTTAVTLEQYAQSDIVCITSAITNNKIFAEIKLVVNTAFNFPEIGSIVNGYEFNPYEYFNHRRYLNWWQTNTEFNDKWSAINGKLNRNELPDRTYLIDKSKYEYLIAQQQCALIYVFYDGIMIFNKNMLLDAYVGEYLYRCKQTQNFGDVEMNKYLKVMINLNKGRFYPIEDDKLKDIHYNYLRNSIDDIKHWNNTKLFIDRYVYKFMR